jgi:hypothetical protein
LFAHGPADPAVQVRLPVGNPEDDQ